MFFSMFASSLDQPINSYPSASGGVGALLKVGSPLLYSTVSMSL
ncbi:hypothetical protein [Clostridium neonatale]|nr:hypothetical protein [Clostridium neonatale]